MGAHQGDRPMTGNATDRHIDRLVKARWRDIGLSQTDLAEALGALPKGNPKQTGVRRVDGRRLMQVAEALVISAGSGHLRAGKPRRARSSANPESLHSLLELRLLRIFRTLQDYDTKRMLIDLTEQIAKRQGARPG